MKQGFAKPRALPVLLWKEWRQQRWTAAGLSARRHPQKLVQFGRGAGGCIGVMALFLLPAAFPRFYLIALATPEAYWRPMWIGTVVVPGRAVFTAMWRPAAEGGGEELVIARCTPSAAEATLLRVRRPPAPRPASGR